MVNMNSQRFDKEQNIRPAGARGNLFEIHVKGHLDSSWSDWLEGMEVKCLENGQMILCGYISDQAALMGVLNRLYGLNLALLSVSEVEPKESYRSTNQKGE